MPFSSLLFVSGFLPFFLLAYFAGPRRWRNAVALGFSFGFYAWGAPAFLPVVVLLGVIDYVLSHAISRTGAPRTKRALVGAGVVVHLATLAYLKYSNFFVAQSNDLLRAMGIAHTFAWSSVALPIGISFITFEGISYLVDVYRGDARRAQSLSHYLLFSMLFPHSIAGPIFRWKDLEAQLGVRQHTTGLFIDGFRRFALGLAKKVLVANSVATAADAVFTLAATPEGRLDARLAWIGVVAYTLEIYFDFSGYSDMAIGLGKMIGFTFKENFNLPYTSASITEFWTRWHISLSTWLRDYLYIPLGGNRLGGRRTFLNIFTVFLLSGFWHGANWNYVVWGAYHGGWVMLERLPGVQAIHAKLPRPVRIAVAMVAVMVGWVFFRATTLRSAWKIIAAMFGGGEQRSLQLLPAEYLSHRSATMILVGIGIAALPLFVAKARTALEAPLSTRAGRWIATLMVPACLVLSMAYLANAKFSPLIYFKF